MNKGRRICAVFLAVCLITTALLPNSVAAINMGVGTATYQTVHRLAQRTTLTQNVLQHNTAGLQNERYIEWSPGDQLTPVVGGYDYLYNGATTIQSAAAYQTSRGNNVVAGINGDFFALATGVPMGIMVSNGVLYSSDNYYPAIGFNSNGTAYIGTPDLRTTLTHNGTSYGVDHINKTRAEYGLYLYTQHYGTTTKFTTQGTSVVLNTNSQLTIGGAISATVQQIVTGNTAIDLGAGRIVLSIQEGLSLQRIQNMKVGDTVTFAVRANDTRFSTCYQAIGGNKIILQNSAVVSGLETTRAPRTAVGVRSDGSVVLYTVDGRQSTHSVGLGLGELAERMRTLGCVTALNLDGGGSTSMLGQYPGETGLTLLGKPSDGSQRKCANHLFLVNNTSKTGVTSQLHVKPESMTVLLGADQAISDIAVTATDTNYHTVAAPTDLFWTSSNQAIGTVTDGIFTALQRGTTTVSAYSASNLNLSGATVVSVVDTLDEIKLYNETTNKEVTELSLSLGETVELRAVGVYQGKEMASRDEAFSWQMTGSAATVTASGLVTAGQQHGTVSYLVVAMGNTTRTIPVSVGKSASPIATFESAAQTPFSATQLGTGFERDATRSMVKYGHNAGLFKYDFSMANGAASLSWPSAVNVSETPGYINFWLKGDGSGNLINLLLTDTAGYSMELTAATLSGTSYQFISIKVPDFVRFDGIKLIQAGNNAVSGSFHIDQVLAAFDPYQDTTPPQVTFTKQGSLTDGTLLISGTVRDTGGAVLKKSDISVLWDGASQTFTYDPVTGMLSAAITMPTEGYHRITVEARDASGNYERVSQVFAQPTVLRTASFTDIYGHWGAPFIEYLDRKGIYEQSIRTFAPDSTITRLEVAVLLNKLLGYNTADYANVILPYKDAALIPAYAQGAVKALYAEGIIRGSSIQGELLFNGSGTLTAAELYTIVSNTFPVGMQKPMVPFAFVDAAEIPNYAAEPISLLMQLQIIEGDNNNRIGADRTINRAQLAKLMCSVF